MDLEEKQIKPGLFSGVRRFKNSVQRNAIRFQVGTISKLQGAGEGIEKGTKFVLNKVSNSKPVQSGRRFVRKVANTANDVKDAVVEGANIVKDTVVDAYNNSAPVQHEKRKMAERRQVFDARNERSRRLDESQFKNGERRSEKSRKAVIEERERRKNGGNNNNNNP